MLNEIEKYCKLKLFDIIKYHIRKKLKLLMLKLFDVFNIERCYIKI